MLLLLIGSSLTAFAFCLILTPVILKLAHHKEWLDNPNHRSVHKDPVPRLGGVGIFLSFFLAMGIAYAWDTLAGGILPAEAKSWTSLLVLLGLLSTFLLGLLDDFIQFRAIYKFLLQMLGAFLAIGAGLTVTELTVPFTSIVINLGPFGPFLTLLWIIGITNAVNLIDGMDGLAGGYSVLAFSMVGVTMAMTGHWFAATGCFVIVGAVLGFLVFNFPPAKIFMGDAGSLSLGYFLAILTLWGGPTDSLFHHLWILPFTIVLIPVGDTTSAILRRLRQRVPIWSPDKEHTHHKLLRMGFTTRQVLAIIYTSVVITASPVLVLALWPANAGPLLLWVTLGSIAIIVGLFSVLHIAYRKRFPDPVKEAAPSGS